LVLAAFSNFWFIEERTLSINTKILINSKILKVWSNTVSKTFTLKNCLTYILIILSKGFF